MCCHRQPRIKPRTKVSRYWHRITGSVNKSSSSSYIIIIIMILENDKIKSSFSNETLAFEVNCNGYDQLVTGHPVIQFSL